VLLFLSAEIIRRNDLEPWPGKSSTQAAKEKFFWGGGGVVPEAIYNLYLILKIMF